MTMLITILPQPNTVYPKVEQSVLFRRLVKILYLRKLYRIVLVHRSTLLFLTLAILVEQKKLLAEILRPIENESINDNVSPIYFL